MPARDKNKRRACAARYRDAHRKEIRARGRARMAALRVNNPDRIKAIKCAFHAAHREELNAKTRAYYAAHREEKKAGSRARYAAHREKIKEQTRRRYYSKKQIQTQIQTHELVTAIKSIASADSHA